MLSESQKEDKAIVIPDSIEPVVGWKALNLWNNKLRSPQKGTLWPKHKPLEAKCPDGAAVTGVWKTGHIGSYQPEGDLFLSWTKFSWSIDIPDIPEGPLPREMEWQLYLERIEHDVAGSGCSCGIYITNDLQYAAAYGEILVRVAGWGTTTVHAAGYRVAYAYPQEIYVSSEHQRKLVAGYGVPVMLRSEAPQFFNRTDKPVFVTDPERIGLKAITLGVLIGQVFIQSALFLLNHSVFHACMVLFSVFAVGVFWMLTRFRR